MHIGVPVMNIGSLLSDFAHAFSLGSVARVPGFPVRSAAARSSAKPGMHCYRGIVSVDAVTRSAKYSSLTTARGAREPSLLQAHPWPPRKDTMLKNYQNNFCDSTIA